MALRAANPRIHILRSQERSQSTSCLGARETERLEGLRAGDAILCIRGNLWITQAGDPQDYLLAQGQKFVASRRGLVVVQAFTDSAYRCVPDFRGASSRAGPFESP